MNIGVTLCCTYSDLAVMQKLGALLRDEGIAVELLPGIERDPKVLELQLASDEGPTIYVLANSKVLEATRLEVLVQMFATERGPAHRLLVLDVDADDPSRMVLPVVRAHAAMRKHRSSGEIPRGTKRGVPTPRKTPSGTLARVDRDTTQRQVEPLGLGVDAPAPEVDVRRASRSSDDRYAFGIDLPPPGDVDDRSVTEYGNEQRRSREVIHLPARRPGSSQNIPRVDDSPRKPGSSQNIPRIVERRTTPPGRAEDSGPRAIERKRTPGNELAPAARERPRKPSPAPRRKVTPREIGVVVEVRPKHDDRSPAEPPIEGTQRRPRLDPVAGRVARDTARQLEAQREVPLPARRRSNTLWLALGGLALVLTASALVLADGSEPEDVTTQRGIAASGIAKPSAESEAKSEPKSETKTPPAKAPPREEQAKETAAKPRPIVRDPVEEAQQIAAALEAKQIHAVDALLFVTPLGSPIDWSSAESSCKTAAVDRIGGWRLPSVGEARKLRGARRLRPGRYWTSEAAEDDTVSVVASGGGRPSPIAKTDTALVVCVRLRIG